MAVIILTDIEEKRAISVVCDNIMKYQIGLRTSGGRMEKLLPEVMLAMLSEYADTGKYEINIHSIVDGEYKTTLMNLDTLNPISIRLSDAILLSLVADFPIYIDNRLMHTQCSLYDGTTDRMAIPINTLDTEKLKEELNKAIETENYRLASHIKEEINKREKAQ